MYKRVTKKKFVCFQSLLKLHNKSSYCASGFCENYTRKTPLYIYYIISTGADAACVFLATCYTVIVPMRCGTQEKGDGTTTERIHCKGGEQKNAIRFRVRYRGRGYYGGLPAIRAYKVKRRPRPCGARFQKMYDYQQLLSINKEC